MRILIAGCGDVGGALGEMLAANGHEVFGLRRSVHHLPETINPIKADLLDVEQLRECLPRSLHWVFYTAAAGDRDPNAYRNAYVRGLSNVLSALQARGEQPRHVFFTSSTGVYGINDGGWVDESTPTEPSSFSGEILLEGERLLHRSPFRTTAVRFAGIYGPGRTWLLRQAWAGRGGAQTPPVYTNRIHRDDCAAMLMHLMGDPSPAETYIGVDCEPAPRFEVISWLAKELSRPQPMPEAVEGGSRGNKRCNNARILGTGFRFRYPSYREGYAELLKTFRDAQGD